MDKQYYDICMSECNNAMKTMLDSPPQRLRTPSPVHRVESPIHVDVDDSFGSAGTDQTDSFELPPLPDDDDDDEDEEDEKAHEQPQDFSMKARLSVEEPSQSKELNECLRRTTAAPKKKWIRQHMKGRFVRT